ncbi:SGNH/GDSL hydrolase family protein [Hymenobacter sp. BT190]|uniref:SGNH/GDSL hydrolase family protein n=1 Tax=Hymenobacter sp. BT190 TaxID=2763505 RepID=UPI0016511351|nr:SGNH/GDSL hydrolase family protein [Hymenobacter sp. BT190]MBC6699824.1 SGNH/GDSL hydrolase family protein [Hymenobacter sp. BT190]
MNTFSLKKTWPAVALLGMAACQPELDAPAVDKGSADFSSYVAVGNSLTAGFQSGGLANFGIETSYPAILAQQFAKAGGGDFVSPKFDESQKDGSGYLKFYGITTAGSPVILQPGQSTSATLVGETAPRTFTNNPADYRFAFTGRTLPAPPLGSGAAELAAFNTTQPNNLGVPGISVLSADRTASTVPQIAGAAQAYGNLNNYYQRLLPAADRGVTDYTTFIGRKNATFFTCWLGNNDVLTYATNGAVAVATNPFSNLTDTTSFGRGYRNIVRTMSRNGTVGGVVANIPNVTNIPYFTAVTVASVLAGFQRVNPAAPAVFIQPGAAGAAVRPATAADLIALPAASVVATGVGSTPTNPIPNNLVLDAAEVTAIQTRTTQFNTIIAKTARQYKVGLVDMNSFFSTVALGGIAINGTANNAGFIRGNLFSLDGVHPTSRGYAVIANEFIKVINATYGASIQPVNPTEYNALLLP